MNKFKMVFALLLVFILVLATNIMDNKSFTIVKTSIMAIYEDRLVANDLLYKFSKHINNKRFHFSQNDLAKFQQSKKLNNDSINSFIEQYSNTKLTFREHEHFEALKIKIERLFALENTYLKEHNEGNFGEDKAEILEQYNRINADLDVLSNIQLSEGKRQLSYSIRAVESSDFISKIEIGFLILIGLILQIFIFYKPSKV